MTGDPFARVQVGDPAPSFRRPRVCTVDDSAGWHCTRERGHPGKHIADNGRRVVATWFGDPGGAA